MILALLKRPRSGKPLGIPCWEILRFLEDWIMHAEVGQVLNAVFDCQTPDWVMFADYVCWNWLRIEIFCLCPQLLRKGKHSWEFTDFQPLLEKEVCSVDQLGELSGDLLRQNCLSFDPTTARYQV